MFCFLKLLFQISFFFAQLINDGESLYAGGFRTLPEYRKQGVSANLELYGAMYVNMLHPKAVQHCVFIMEPIGGYFVRRIMADNVSIICKWVNICSKVCQILLDEPQFW